MKSFLIKNIFWLFPLFLLSSSVMAQEQIIEQDESFDPMDLNEPPMPLTDKTMIYEIITDIDEKLTTPRSIVDSLHVVEKMGWKVQIFSSDDSHSFSISNSPFISPVRQSICWY